MQFNQTLRAGTLLRRYKRFLADIELDDGTLLTAACPNTGSMLGCCTPGSRVWLSQSDSPTRKYRHTWELVAVGGVLIGINTGLPNKLVREAIERGVISELGGTPVCVVKWHLVPSAVVLTCCYKRRRVPTVM